MRAAVASGGIQNDIQDKITMSAQGAYIWIRKYPDLLTKPNEAPSRDQFPGEKEHMVRNAQSMGKAHHHLTTVLLVIVDNNADCLKTYLLHTEAIRES